jgi:hypothetical protein
VQTPIAPPPTTTTWRGRVWTGAALGGGAVIARRGERARRCVEAASIGVCHTYRRAHFKLTSSADRPVRSGVYGNTLRDGEHGSRAKRRWREWREERLLSRRHGRGNRSGSASRSAPQTELVSCADSS